MFLPLFADNSNVLWRRVGDGPLKNAHHRMCPVKGCFNLQAAANAPGAARIKLVH